MESVKTLVLRRLWSGPWQARLPLPDLSWAFLALPAAQDSMPALWGCKSLPQQPCSRASLQLPAALPCPAMGPAKPGAVLVHSPSWPQSICVPREVPHAQGWGCTRCSRLPWLLAEATGWALPASPYPATLKGNPCGGPQRAADIFSALAVA